MNSDIYGLIDAAIVAIPVLGFAIWQWVSVSREIDRDKAAKRTRDESE
ncbi:hypothetical protein [Sphingomonas qomolangmaensis]|uniref:Uncharacterized protein n=1 Tax=Sphingomonas qomolangmaensis TaxID=2918765 RepID=A0ABY5LAH9_9SPHN|nr:hypothetical protein [Sphingomonas qomolangmaensis]UUL83048.1 hypothetical protein NMP03_02095 [Sphingomonas qomolangmaensis]